MLTHTCTCQGGALAYVWPFIRTFVAAGTHWYLMRTDGGNLIPLCLNQCSSAELSYRLLHRRRGLRRRLGRALRFRGAAGGTAGGPRAPVPGPGGAAGAEGGGAGVRAAVAGGGRRKGGPRGMPCCLRVHR